MNDFSKPRVLVVDDSASNLHVLVEALRQDYDIRIAKDGRAALQIVHEQTLPDLILLDVMMPGMDGYEVADRLKASSLTFDIPIIFITAKDSVQDEERGLAIGALDYITKPFNLAVVKARVKNHIRLKLQQDELLHQKEELEKALGEIKTLKGFLPICSHCNNIRDDQGGWNQMEAYISEHSGARFSHSICPDCAKKFYSDLKLGSRPNTGGS